MNSKTKGFEKMLDDRFGMFVHYGIYSAMAGSFNGVKCDWLGEWIQHRLEIPIAEYEKFGRENFLTRPDFAKNLVSHAKAAGIKYIVLTSKHHDGFCLFKSDYTNYSTYNFFSRDICKELADECRRQGLEVGFYYSHTLDWYEKNAGGNFYSSTGLEAHNRNYWDYPDNNIDFKKYLREKCFPQVRELLTNYGDLKLIWFDFPHDITKEQSMELRELVKSIQPDCQINSRIAHNCNDYESLGDNALPIAPVGANTECLVTLNDTWGYKAQDNNWKTPEENIGILCRALCADSSLLLNVGPKGDGSLTNETINILDKMGEWTSRNCEAVYDGVRGNPFSTLFPWGYAAHKENNLYLYIEDDKTDEITINIGKENVVCDVDILGYDTKPEYSIEGNQIKIKLIECPFNVPVYKIEFSSKPVFSDKPMQNADTLSLGVLWAGKVLAGRENVGAEKLKYEKSAFIPDYGRNGLAVNQNCHAYFWTDSSEIMCWDACFEEAGEYSATLVHALPEENEKNNVCDFKITVGDTTNDVNMREELLRYSISRTEHAFNMRIGHDAGKFTIAKPGKYRIFLQRGDNGEIVPVTNVEFKKIK